MSVSKKKQETKPQPKESQGKKQTSESFKKRHNSDVGSSVLEDLKKATQKEREFRKEREGRD